MIMIKQREKGKLSFLSKVALNDNSKKLLCAGKCIAQFIFLDLFNSNNNHTV